MNLTEIKNRLIDIEAVLFHQTEVGRCEKDRPIGMKKTAWEALIWGVDDLLDGINNEIIKQQKQFLTQ